jgi:hypothetical protein
MLYINVDSFLSETLNPNSPLFIEIQDAKEYVGQSLKGMALNDQLGKLIAGHCFSEELACKFKKWMQANYPINDELVAGEVIEEEKEDISEPYDIYFLQEEHELFLELEPELEMAA